MDHRDILADKCIHHRDRVRLIHMVRDCRRLGVLVVKLAGKMSLNAKVVKGETAGKDIINP